MALFQLNYENKTNLIFITAFIWVINFRTSFKNIDDHMDTGCYASVKYDPVVILIKNIVCILFIAGYIYEKRISKVQFKLETLESKKIAEDEDTESKVIYQKTEKEIVGLSFEEALNRSNALNNEQSKSLNFFKIFISLLITYASEEIYFIFSNNHILDRVIVNMRNFWILIFLLFVSPFVIKKSSYTYRHQLFPSIIIIFIALFMILFNAIKFERFNKIFGWNLIAYFGSFFLMGLELSLLKYLLSIEFVSMYLIMFFKGVIGTVIFLIINLYCDKDDFFNFLDKILSFEYDFMNEEFHIFQKCVYIISLISTQFLKIFTINTFSQNHILSSIMISDLIYLPFYLIERFAIQDFKISQIWSFAVNTIIGGINVILMSVFNEILECKFWEMDVNLIKNINERQKKDYKQGSINLRLHIEDENDDDEMMKNRSSNLSDSQDE